jgi:predicted glycosyltransferase
MVVKENLRLLPNRSDFFHPDLINASDAVIGKAGYSTIAEVYHAGVPFGYVTRSQFRESEALADYIKGNLNGIALGEDGFQDGDWIRYLPDLVSLPRIQRSGLNGAVHVARFIGALLNG